MGHMLRAATDDDPSATILSVDGIGAHDHILRSAMLERLATMREVFAILPFVRLSYGTPSRHSWWDEEGGEQGDPLSVLHWDAGALEEVAATEEERRLWEAIPFVSDLQCGWQILLQSANPGANHTLRTVPPSLSREYAVAHDDGLWGTAHALLGQIPGSADELSQARSMATLLMRMGGLGLRCAERIREAGYWSSWADALSMIHHRNPSIAEVKYKFIKTTFIKKKFSSKTTFIKNQFHQKTIFIKMPHFHQKPFSSKTNFIKNQFHQRPLSSKTIFIKNQFHQKPISSEHFLSEGPSHKHGLCPPLGSQLAFLLNIAGRRPAMFSRKAR